MKTIVRSLAPLAILVLAGCQRELPSDVEPTTISAAVGQERAQPLARAVERVDTVHGRRFRLQTQAENGAIKKQMLFQDDTVPLVLSEFTTNSDKKVTHVRNTWYATNGDATFITEHEIKKQSVLGRCLQLFLPTELLAQTGGIYGSGCGTQATAVAIAGTMAATAALRAVTSCAGVPLTASACVTATAEAAAKAAAYVLAQNAYNNCVGSTGGGWTGGGGSSTKKTSFPSDPNGNPVGGGGFATCVTTRIYTLSLVLISETTVCQ